MKTKHPIPTEKYIGKHIGKNLYSPFCHIISSDEDQPMVMDMYAGFNIHDQVVISIDFHDYDQPKYNCSTAVVVNREDSLAMARRHRVNHSQLPVFIAECMEEWNEIINPTFTQVVDCFEEIIECLLDEGCRFHIDRTHGHNDFTCC